MSDDAADIESNVQTQRLFYDNGCMPHLPPPPLDEDIRVALAENNVKCPLNEIIVSEANQGNMRNLRRFAYTAYKRINRSCRGCNFGIFSPAGQGKTFVVKKFAETIGIPFVFVQSPSLESTYHLFEQIQEAFEKFGTPIVQVKDDNHDFYLPPCIVFFDEAHELRTSLMKGALLNAMEPDDAYMVIKQPGSKGSTHRVDCYEVCWVAATTDRGDLFDAFDSRLTTAIEWASADGEELTGIIEAGLNKKVRTGELPFAPPREVCKLIAQYQKVPRLAIHGFGAKVVQQKDYIPSHTWEECCQIVASDIGLNQFGFTKKQTAILAALGKRPIAEGRLSEIAQCRVSEVKKYVMPGLMQYVGGGPYVVSVTGRGMCLTRAGLRLLEKMGISHRGEKITAEYFESRR